MGAVERWIGGRQVDLVSDAEQKSMERIELHEIARTEDLCFELIEQRTLAQATEIGLQTEFGVIDRIRPQIEGDPFKAQIAEDRIRRMSRTNGHRLEATFSRPPRRRR